MKNIILLTLISILLSASYIKSSIDDKKFLSKLDSYYEMDDFFKMKAAFEINKKNLSEKSTLYYSAMINHVFNKQEESNKNIDQLIKVYSDELSDTLLHQIFRAKLMNHVNLYEYADAAEASRIIVDNYSVLEDTADFSNLKNEWKIWNALSNVPKQNIIRESDSQIEMKRDKVGLMNISTLFGTDTVNFLFDTGANFSAITRSLAEKLQMEIMDVDFYVTAATGKEVKSDLAIAKEFRIANLTIKNAVFLVFDDEDLSFPQIEYYLNGAIGFPIIEALEELRFDSKGNIFVPQNPTPYEFNNLALNGLTPVLAVQYKNDTLNFNFDTGGNTTTLYHSFYEKYRSDIDSKYELQTFGSGSGGGVDEFSGYVIDSLSLEVGESMATIHSVRLHKESVYDKVESVHGNFGQDYIKQFDKMVISFKYSSVIFE